MKSRIPKDPFKNLVLDKYEQEIEDALERGEYKSASKEELEETKKMFKEAAKNYRELQKSKRITVRLKQMDLIKLKAKAKEKNIPYQTLLNVLIRDFVEGKYSIKL